MSTKSRQAGKQSLDKNRLMQFLKYEPNTGIFTWLVKRGKAKKNDIAGHKQCMQDENTYLRIMIDSRMYLCHRLAWLYVYGEWPKNHIDHINHLKSDNRIANLRDVTRAENSENQAKAQKSNKSSGVLGVRVKTGREHYKNPFAASIKVRGINKHIGNFPTAEEAHSAYLEAKRKFHKGWTI